MLSLLVEEKLGGSIGAVRTCSRTGLLVTSVFPDNTRESHRSCGISVFSIDDILNERRFNTKQFIDPSELECLPHTLRFGPNGRKLYCLGSTCEANGSCNEIYAYDLVNRSTSLLLREQDTRQSHCISNVTAEGHYAIFRKDELRVYDRSGHILWQQDRGRGIRRVHVEAHLGPDSETVYTLQDQRLFVFRRGTQAPEPLPHLGHVAYVHARSDREVVAFTAYGDAYRPVVLDVDDLRRPRHVTFQSDIEPVNPDGFDVMSDGTLCVSDREGGVRLFSRDLSLKRRVPSPRGPVSQILADPHRPRVALLSASGAVMMYEPSLGDPEVYVGLSTKAPIERGRSLVVFPTHRPGHLMFNHSRDVVWVRIDDTRSIEASGDTFYGDIVVWGHDWETFDKTQLARLSVDSPVRDAVELKGWVVVVLEDGLLFAFDPHRLVTDMDCEEESTPDFDSPYCKRIAETIPSPQGLARVPGNRLAAWTSNSVALYEFDDSFQVIGKRELAVEGVRRIRYDTHKELLVLAYRDCLAFWSLQLEEIARLYLLRRGSSLVWVPYPETLQTGVNENHPGYFWSDAESHYDLFDVRDQDGEAVSKEQKRTFLDAYRDETLVRRATTDWKAFRSSLADQNPALRDNRLRCHLLPG